MKQFFTVMFLLLAFHLTGQKETVFEPFVTQVIYETQYDQQNGSIFLINDHRSAIQVDLKEFQRKLNEVDLMLLNGFKKDYTYWDHVKANVPQKIGMYVFGIGDGIADVIRNKYDRTWLTQYGEGFQQWADPRISWKNKYWHGNPENGPKFFLSNGALVFMTDFWHLAKTIRNTGMRVGMYTYKHPPKGKWQYYAYDFVGDLLIMAAGWQTSNLILQIK